MIIYSGANGFMRCPATKQWQIADACTGCNSLIQSARLRCVQMFDGEEYTRDCVTCKEDVGIE
jgi:hypothetical protein